MQKIFFISFALVLAAVCTSDAQPRMAVGFVIGGSFNMHSGGDLQKSGTGVGFVGGGQLDLALSDDFSLLSTLYAYDNRLGGYSYSVTQDAIDYALDVNVTVAYAGLSPLVKFTMPDRRFFLVAGPSIEFKVQGQSVIDATITTPGYSFSNGYATKSSTSELQDVNTRFELNVGAGYAYKIDFQSRLTAQLTFAYGLNNIEKNVEWRISSVRLVAGLEFDIFR